MLKKILIVDDEPDILTVTTYRLEKLGYEISTAIDGREALNVVHKETPDLIFLDLLLPIINGYEVCKQIKADERLKRIPVVLFTASVVHDILEKVKETGADDYLLKPFTPEDLLEKVRRFMI